MDNKDKETNKQTDDNVNMSTTKKSSVIIAMAVLVIIVGGIVAGAVYFLNNKTKTASDKPSATTNAAAGSTNQQQSNSQSTAPNAKGSTATPQSNPTAAPTPTTPSHTSSVAITSTAFSPSVVTVKKGTAVTWTNKDTANHAIAGDDAASGLHSPQLKPNESYTHTFATAGTYHYTCAINPALSGTVTVTE